MLDGAASPIADTVVDLKGAGATTGAVSQEVCADPTVKVPAYAYVAFLAPLDDHESWRLVSSNWSIATAETLARISTCIVYERSVGIITSIDPSRICCAHSFYRSGPGGYRCAHSLDSASHETSPFRSGTWCNSGLTSYYARIADRQVAALTRALDAAYLSKVSDSLDPSCMPDRSRCSTLM